jgi:hypothetical protein
LKAEAAEDKSAPMMLWDAFGKDMARGMGDVEVC